MVYTFVIRIHRKPGLSDPEGATTARALQDLGFEGVEHVSFGRTITIDVNAENSDNALDTVESMCTKLLANPVIEHYTIEALS